MNRCINIDWLEVYCHEPQDWRGNGIINQQYLENLGCKIFPRGYGTPLYEEMFSVAFGDCPNIPFVEIRRKPRKDANGNCVVHLASCHIRLRNIFCYVDYPIVGFCNFLLKVGYIFKSIKRIDLCLDFNFFDNGEQPLALINAYLCGKLSKINQSKLSAHGADQWDGRFWNSLKWGSPSSNITTKLYNKTLEMKQVSPKTYIQDAWKDAGLRTDIDVWRLEFSIKAGNKGFKNTQSQEFHKMKISQFATRAKQLFIFHSLCAKYFHFKYCEKTADGKFKRKDRCKDKQLFVVSLNESIYTPATIKGIPDPTRMDKIVMKKCYEMSHKEYLEDGVREAAKIVADNIAERLAPYLN